MSLLRWESVVAAVVAVLWEEVWAPNADHRLTGRLDLIIACHHLHRCQSLGSVFISVLKLISFGAVNPRISLQPTSTYDTCTLHPPPT
jgi:hypothetical protein